MLEGIVPTVNLATGNGSNGGNNGFGDGAGAWWIIILFLFVFCGWGNGNWGGNGGSGSGSVMDAYVLNSDFATLQRLIDNGFDRISGQVTQVNNGLCSGFYEVASQFNTTNSNIMQGNFALQNAINGVSSQIAQCCCDVRQGLSEINFNNAQNTCAITNSINTGIRDVLENCNANYRALHDEIVANRIEDKNAQIAMLQTKLNNAELAASQTAQSAYLISELSPKFPVPAFLTCNPYTGQTYSNGYGYGYNNGCGC